MRRPRVELPLPQVGDIWTHHGPELGYVILHVIEVIREYHAQDAYSYACARCIDAYDDESAPQESTWLWLAYDIEMGYMKLVSRL